MAIIILIDIHTDYSSILEHGFGNFVPSIVYLVIIGFLIRKQKWVVDEVKTQPQVVAISTAMILAAVLSAISLFLFMPDGSPFLSFDRFSIQGIATYSLGDIAGILFMWSGIEFVRSAYSSSRLEIKNLSKDILMVIMPVLALVIFLMLSAPGFGWAILAIIFVPIVYLSTRHGWVGATASIVILNLIAGMLYLLNGSTEALFNAQLFLVTVGITGLFLGAAISEQNKLIRGIRDMSQRVIQTQEKERSRISKDLHDHVGQILTALRLRIVILHQKKDSDIKGELDALDKLAAEAYQDVHDIVDELSPNELIQFGLQRSLDSPGFHQMLREANINYHAGFTGPVSDMPEHIQLAIYRTTQEILSNIVKYSKAKDCKLTVCIKGEGNKKTIGYTVKDNGIGFNVDSYTKGHGIQNMQDRVQALGGSMILNSGTGGTSIAIAIPL